MNTDSATSLDKANKTSPSAPSHIVGIGASAGGLKALELFFTNMPTNSGMAFVVVQHLSPDFKSLMNDLLARYTAMPIYRAEDGMPVAANTIYLVPSKSYMTLRDGKLHLTERNRTNPVLLTIDLFFQSLAEAAQERAIGIILSGTGSDGSRGIRAIAAAKGLVLVQTPESAQFDGMPRSAQTTDVVDFVLTPDVMPCILLEYARDPATLTRPDPHNKQETVAEDDYSAIFMLLRKRYRIDFAQYKIATVGRRIERRIALRRLQHITDYIALLSDNPEELDALYHDLLIGVTEFFRDPDAFAVLHKIVIPNILSGAASREGVRVWVTGCATGEEAYSIAILFHEAAQEHGFTEKISIFATDAHAKSLSVASNGVYDSSSLLKLSPERRERYFHEIAPDQFKVSPKLRRMVFFAPHNVVADPPFTRIDLVCCRNLLIYLQTEAQERALKFLHFALNVNGVLFLGTSEGLGDLTTEFEAIDHHWKIFRKLHNSKFTLPLMVPPRSNTQNIAFLNLELPNRSLVRIDRQLLDDYDFLLSQYIPPSLLIDEQRRVLHYFGAITDYLKAPSGRPDDDVLSLLEDNLALALSTTLRRVEANHPVMTRSIPTKTVQGEQLIDLLVQWLPNSRTGRSHYHIAIFQTRAHAADESAPDTNTEVISFQSQGETHTRIADLELELQYIHESLQATIEELQTSNEELQATNQELLAANEELQSTNEELQSVNEELFTVNAEFEAKNQELRESNQDLDNLLRSIRVGIIFMDRRLRIRKFNPAIAGFFDLLPQDIGRPIEHIAYHLPGQQEMMAEVRQMIATGVPSEQELQTLDSRWFLRRILPFTTDTNTIEGAVLSFTDVSSIKLAEEAARISEQRYRGALESSLDLFMLLEAVHDASDEIIDFRFIELNQPALDHMQMERTEVIGQLLCQLFPLNRTDPLLFPEYMRVAETGKPIIRELRDFNNQVNVSRWFYQQVVKAGDGIAVTSSDITDYKNAEAALLASLREKEVLLKEIHHRVKNNLQIIGSLLNIHIDMVESPDIQHTLQAVKARVQSMAMLHDQIYNSDNLANIQFEPYARQLADTLLQTLSEPDKLITVQVDSDPITLTLDQGVSIGLLLNEFLLNALKHAFPERHTGSIQVTLRAMPDDWGVLIVADDGVGLPPPGAGNERRGVGSEIIEAIIAQLRGTIERKSENGLQITVQFPGLKLESVLQQDPVL